MKRIILIVALIVITIVLAGCGGSEPEATTLSFDALEPFAFSPDAASAEAGGQVEVTLKNVGVLDHTWMLVSENADPATVTDSEAIAGSNTGIVAAGDSKTISFTAPSAGTYQFVCTVEGHAEGGMVGKMTID